MNPRRVDAVVVGGGFFGCSIATWLSRRAGLGAVALVEREAKLLTRSSFNNQARIHSGYHYPRSFTTAYRSWTNHLRFASDYSDAVIDDFDSCYAVARHGSLVNAARFEHFCAQIGAPLRPAPRALRGLLSERWVEASYLVEEFVFDASKLRRQIRGEVDAAGVELLVSSEVREIGAAGSPSGVAVVVDGPGGRETIVADLIFNCTYAGLTRRVELETELKFEITEMALIEPPAELEGTSVTLMDGPFFSVMPFPALGLYSLSHVRYTPHAAWTSSELPELDPYAVMDAYARQTRGDRMIRDAARYLPCLASARQVDSLFEVKTVLAASEVDDGRPILFERSVELPGLVSVMGSKIDNIYDVFAALAALTGVAPEE